MIRELKSQYKIGFLSNASANLLHDLFTPEQVQLFDVASISYETGFSKPDERAYTITAARLEVEPEECVFVDDVERNCTAARDVGMQAVWYQSLEQTVNDLRKILANTED